MASLLSDELSLGDGEKIAVDQFRLGARALISLKRVLHDPAAAPAGKWPQTSLPPAVECWVVGLAGFMGRRPAGHGAGSDRRLLARLLARLADAPHDQSHPPTSPTAVTCFDQGLDALDDLLLLCSECLRWGRACRAAARRLSSP